MIDLSVIIVNYNVRYYLSQCLHAALRAMDGLDGEIFVVDNNSSDGSVEMVEERFGDQVILIANKDNPGFAKANNQAMRQAQGRYILLLNPDTLVSEDAFTSCLTYMDDHPTVGGLGIYMQDGHGAFLPESKRALPTPWVSFYKIFGLSRLFPRSRKFGQYHLTYLDQEETHDIEILSGAYMWMRKEALDKVGLLDETYFMYGEDIDLSWRLIEGGYQNAYFSESEILHYKGESTKKGSLNYVRVFYQAMIIFAKRHFAGNGGAGFIVAIRTGVYIRAILAVMQRFVKRYGFPILETGLIYGILYGIKRYWEHYVKYIEGGEYPAEFVQQYLPVYALIFVGLLALSGAYRKPFRLRPLLTAPFLGFITIATGTYMFPFIENFSRAIVGLGAVFTSLLALGTRGLINWRENGQFFFTESARKRVLLVGTADEVDEATSIIRSELDYPVELLGAASEEAPEKIPHLGDRTIIGGLIELFKVDEVIFVSRESSIKSILTEMKALAGHQMDMKILPKDDSVLIGPQTIVTPQVGRSLTDRLRDPVARRQKRSFEVVGSLLMLMVFPVSFWAYRSPGSAFKALINVLTGRRSLVGYAGTAYPHLPSIRSGYLSLLDRNRSLESVIPIEELDALYAREYHWETDLEICWKAWRRIGFKQE